jgi:CBS domain containing-hemolysin-like protein
MIAPGNSLAVLLGSAACAAVVVPLMHVPIMRLRKRSKEAILWTVVSFVMSFVAWLIIIPGDKGDPEYASEIAASFALLGFLWLGYLELMFKIYRGFSYTLLTDIARLEPVSEDTLTREFAEGTGIDGMLERRIQTLVAGNLLTREGNNLTLTAKGAKSARITTTYKAFLRLGRGG